MDNPFFSAIEGDGFSATELAQQSKDVLLPFKHYLDNSINALEHKEVSCEWQPVANNAYRLIPDKDIWQLTPISELKIHNGQAGWYEIVSEANGTKLDEDFFPEIEDAIIVGKGAERQRFSLRSEDFRTNNSRYEIYLPKLLTGTEIQWSGYQLVIRPLAIFLDDLEYVHVDGQECEVLQQQDQLLKLQASIGSHSRLTIRGQDIQFELLNPFDAQIVKKYSGIKEGAGWLLFANSQPKLAPHQLKKVTDRYLSQLTAEYLACDGKALDAEQWSMATNNSGLILEARGSASLSEGKFISCARYPALKFSVNEKKVEEKWIQLIEKPGAEDNARSELDYFFSDNQSIKILDSSQGKNDSGFKILKSRPEERQLLLARDLRGKKNWQSEYPSQHGKKCEISVSVDTSQLKRQKEAINQLMSRPATGHLPLIQLLQKRDKIQWSEVEAIAEQEVDWQVLSDPGFDGCQRQREFVCKALGTPDFAILDGPPGTGKTTSILELIFQLVAQGKRILLSASTHAAINNVLERIKENSTLAKTIFPLRIGDENNAIGVEEFQFDNQLAALKKIGGCEGLSKQLMVDASNLVCGTTIGILRLFNDKDIDLNTGEPPFDVMIIDECSKTTFQEFLVPARFAKRWILVGDVKQLSPFTDREQIVANLDNLMLKPGRGKEPAITLPVNVQQACFLLEELRGNSRNAAPYQQPMMVPVSAGVLKALAAEIEARLASNDFSSGLNHILLVNRSNKATLEQQVWRLYDNNLCFVDEAILPEIQPLIPDDMLVLHSNWINTEQAAQYKNAHNKVKPFHLKNNHYSDGQEIQEKLLDRFKESNWSGEVCWRMERDYWLRLSKNYNKKTGYLNDTLKRLFPKSEDTDGRIHVLKNIAFPSILEALSDNGLAKYKRNEPTTLNQGFNQDEKTQRRSSLNFQHRMHPDISAYPRRQFYGEGELADGNKTSDARVWNYNRYQSRNTWLNVKGKTYSNSNDAEVKALIAELKAFCDWAEGKTKNDKGEAYDVAVLTFYKGQEKALRTELQKLPGNKGRYARFNYKGIAIKLATVDYFQGQEADIVYLSMVNTQRDGFMDSPNRLNVSITRARYQMVILGDHHYFSNNSRTEELKKLALSCDVRPGHSSTRN